MIAHPPIHPADGPSARVTQENVVPQSGSARLRAANAPAISSIGTNEASRTPGACTPTSATIGPRTAAREYAGDVDARPMTRASPKPTASGRRVASGGGSTDVPEALTGTVLPAADARRANPLAGRGQTMRLAKR